MENINFDIDAVIEEATEVTGKNPYTTSMHIYTAMNPYMQEVLYNIENEKTDLKYSNASWIRLSLSYQRLKIYVNASFKTFSLFFMP